MSDEHARDLTEESLLLSHHSLQDNISDNVIKAIQPYIDNEEFQPAAIAKVSKACTSICQWVRAMHKYHFVSKVVEPKRVRDCVTQLLSVFRNTVPAAPFCRRCWESPRSTGQDIFVIQGLD